MSLQRPSTDDLETEEIHDVLRNHRRRLVLDILQAADDPVSVRELSERIGAIEADQDPPPRNVRQSVYVSLLQTHLPKLDELGIVDYEPEGRSVSVGEGLREVAIFLETVPKYGLSRSEYYAAVSLLGALTMAAADLGTPVITAVSASTWAYAFLALIFASGLYHTYVQGSSLLQRLLD